MIDSPRAVIDIGSNAIRLVVYGGPSRAPMPIYNEKARISLGECVSKTGAISPEVMQAAIATLVRFDALTKAMKISERYVVATEATRKASNGDAFLAEAFRIGVPIQLMTGKEEALASASGVVCDMPWATGYVADLGGGSLELAKLEDGPSRQPTSMPYGTIPLSERIDLSPKLLAHDIKKRLKEVDGFQIHTGLPLHLVGGAWRTLGQLHMHITEYPISILSNYSIPVDALAVLSKAVSNREILENIRVVPGARIPYMPAALAMVQALAQIFEPSEIVISVYGLREGILYDRLSQDTQRQDPLIAAARHEGARLSRFAYHGDSIADWIAPVFEDDDTKMRRLRHAACLLADSVWNSHPEYRGKHAAELALEGSWPGVNATDRAIMACALYAANGGKRPRPPLFDLLAPNEKLDRAQQWGLAIRLAQRLDGGTGVALKDVMLKRKDGLATLKYADDFQHLNSAVVKRRLKRLNEALVKN